MATTGRPGLGYVAAPAADAGRPVLVIHSWWGMTESFTAYADELATRGFLAGCVDLYGGAIARTATEARELRARRSRQPAYRVLRRCLEQLADDERGTAIAPAVVGFSSGGHWALWLAQHPTPPVSRVVTYYAARGGAFPEGAAAVLAHFAADDDWVPGSRRAAMERALHRAEADYRTFDYPGAGHWFAESAHPAFDPRSAGLALDRTAAFLAPRDD